MKISLTSKGYSIKSKIEGMEDISYEMPLLSPRERVGIADRLSQISENKELGLADMDNNVNIIYSEFITIRGLEVIEGEGEVTRYITSLQEVYELQASEEAIGILQKIRKEAIQVFTDYIKLGLETEEAVKE